MCVCFHRTFAGGIIPPILLRAFLLPWMGFLNAAGECGLSFLRSCERGSDLFIFFYFCVWVMSLLLSLICFMCFLLCFMCLCFCGYFFFLCTLVWFLLWTSFGVFWIPVSLALSLLFWVLLCVRIFLCLCGVCGVVFARNPVFCFVIFYINQFSGPSGSQIFCKYIVNKL